MQTASIHQLKRELETQDSKTLLQLCLRLARFKLENKELLTYLLFESSDEEGYRQVIKSDLENQFAEINKSNIYWTKKSLRKILRLLDKVIRFSGIKETEIELRLHFIRQIKEHRIQVMRNKVISNMYTGQIKKIKSAMDKVHEDLQYDYNLELEEIIKNRTPK